MIPNPDIWGAPTSWEQSALSNIGIYNSWIDGKFPVFDTSYRTDQGERYEINSGVAAGKLTPGEPFDTSCCPWRIKGDSYFLDYKKLWFTDEGSNTYATHTSPLFTQQVRDMGVPVMVTTKIFSSANNAPKITQLSGIWNPLYGLGTQLDVDGTPLLQFNYQKILLHAKINAAAYSDQDISDSSIFTVEDYFENRTQSHPCVRGLLFDVYMWDGTQWRYNDYGSFNIMPVNAEIEGFECGSVAILAENCTIFREGISGKIIGYGGNRFGVPVNTSWADADESTSYYLQQSSSQDSICFAAMPDDWLMATFQRWGDWWAVPYVLNVSEDWVYSQFASLGFWFYTGTAAGLASVDLTNPDEHTHVPMFDDYGTTTGEYKSGTEASLAPASQWTIDVFERDIYHGEPDYDPTHYDDNKTVLPDPLVNYVPHGGTLYCMRQQRLNDVISFLNDTSAQLQNDYESQQKFLAINPIDVISGLLYFPFHVPNFVAKETNQVYIQMGNTIMDSDPDKKATKLNGSCALIDFKSIPYYAPYGVDDFRSYKPYSCAELYIPYCGSVEIDPAEYIGHQVGLKYLVDLTTGACLALVYRDNMVLDTLKGQIGMNVPITAVQTATIQSAVQQAQMKRDVAMLGAVAGAAKMIGGVASGDVSGAETGYFGMMAGIGGIENGIYQLNHIPATPKTVGTASACTSMINEQTPRLIIKRPIMLDTYDAHTYAETIGFACCVNNTLDSFTGFTVVSSADLSGFNAPQEDKILLLSLLQKGVILPTPTPAQT